MPRGSDYEVPTNMVLVSVVIPTLNSANHLESCLQSIEASEGIDVEIIIVDGGSRDATLATASRHSQARIVHYPGKLLGARIAGFEAACGHYILMMDSDQQIHPDSLRRAVDKCRDGFDALVLEEASSPPTSWLSWLIALDRNMLSEIGDLQLDPVRGAALARFFSSQMLNLAMQNIPREILPVVWAHDHAIIYYEVCLLGARVGILKNAITHSEMQNLMVLLLKYYRYGRQAACYIHVKRYQDVFFKKERLRYGALPTRSYLAIVASAILLALKGIPYKLGYYSVATKIQKKVTK